MICHVGFQALAILALASAMILTPFDTETLFITAIGFVALQTTRFFPAAAAAITLATITVAADVKHLTARRKATNEFVKDGGTGSRHWFGEGTLDNRRRSCQDDSRYVGAPLMGAANEKPRLRKQPGFPLYISRGLILPNLAIPGAVRQ